MPNTEFIADKIVWKVYKIKQIKLFIILIANLFACKSCRKVKDVSCASEDCAQEHYKQDAKWSVSNPPCTLLYMAAL